MYKSNIKHSYESSEHVSIETKCGKQYRIKKSAFPEILSAQKIQIQDQSIADKLVKMKLIVKENHQVKHAYIKKKITKAQDAILDTLKKVTHHRYYALTLTISLAVVINHLIFEGKIFNIKSAASVLSLGEAAILVTAMLTSSLIHEVGHLTSYYNYTKDKGKINIRFNYIVPKFSYKLGIFFDQCTVHQKKIIYLSGFKFQVMTVCALSISLNAFSMESQFSDLVISVIAIKSLFNLIPAADSDGLKIILLFNKINVQGIIFRSIKMTLETCIAILMFMSLLHLTTWIVQYTTQ